MKQPSLMCTIIVLNVLDYIKCFSWKTRAEIFNVAYQIEFSGVGGGKEKKSTHF